VELYVGGQLAARGEAVAVAGKLGVRVQEIVPGA
jgi:flagellar motor switch/type III secretory pathway protein FliN